MAALTQNDSPLIRRGRETGRRAGGYALTQNDNPYVGPRTFRPEERAKFFGRSREARDLTAMIISNRLVLFYAPSGAGKSSLLNTLIGPMLVEAGFELLPIGRVSGVSGASAADGGDAARAANIYVYNLLLSLQQAEDSSVDFTSLTLAHFLDNLDQREDGLYAYDLTYVYPPDAIFKPRVLIIDQFEELLTTNRALWAQREGFFEQLAAAMALDEQLWVVLAMREDYVARLRPYLHLTPNRLRARYYMERLTRPAAIEAMQMPVAGIRPFEPEAVAQLADDLRRIRSTGGEESAQFYQFVEPVQLQAVCYQMWQKLRNAPGNRITPEDVAKYANVDTALINFYEETIQKTVAATEISEIDLRAWFDRKLITEAGTRNMVFRGEETTGGLPTAVADFVRGQFILAEVVRPGGAWYELVHERFVEPITAANSRWRQDQPLIQLAQGWAKAGRPAGRLLSGPQLEQLAPSDWQELSPLVAEYVAAAQAAQEAAEKEKQARQLAREQQRAQKAQETAERQRHLKNLLAVAVIAAILLLITAIHQAKLADAARATAEADATRANGAEATAQEDASRAKTAEAEALTAAIRASAAEAEAKTEATRANAAEATAAFQAAEAVVARETSEAARATAEARAISLRDSLATQEAQLALQLSALPMTATPQLAGTRDLFEQATAAALYQQLNQVRATQTAIAQEIFAETIIIGYSVRDIPIEVTRIGFGPNKIVFVGGIHSGLAPSTVTLAEAVSNYFKEHPSEVPRSITLFIVHNLNPDSVRTSALEGRYNANGVDLNRNWDCNWRANPYIRGERRENAGGAAPNSEPETQALANFVLKEQPVAVVFWAGPDSKKPVVPGRCPSVLPETRTLTGLYANASGYNEVIQDEGWIEGDASNWLSDQGIPAIFALLPRAVVPDFNSNLDGVRGVIQHYASVAP